MPDSWYELQSDRSLLPLTLLGEYNGVDGYIPLQVSKGGDPPTPYTPLAPLLTGSMLSRTSAKVDWLAPNNDGRPPITEYRIFRDGSLIDTVSASTLTWTETGLATDTPEIIFVYTVQAVNSDGAGLVSNAVALQWAGTQPQQPTAPTGLSYSGLTSTSVVLQWSVTADATVTKYGIYQGNTLVVDNIDPSFASYTWSGMTPGSSHTNVNVRRSNSVGWSPTSNQVTFTNPASNPTGFTMLMGTSVPNNYSNQSTAKRETPKWGGYTQWDAVRVYAFNAVDDCLDFDPSVIGLTDEPGVALDGGQTSANKLSNFLESFYYDNGTLNFNNMSLASRKNVQVFWANGNEVGVNFTTANAAAIQNTCRLMYAVIHQSTGGVRRFPNAFFGMDPTQFQESQNDVSPWLDPIADILDFVAWSMYPPGQDAHAEDPVFFVPGTDGSQKASYTNNGFLERCFTRTVALRTLARTMRAEPTWSPYITCWEVSNGADYWRPGRYDPPHRPWYAAHSLAQWCYERALHYNLEFHHMLWWDQDIDAGHAILSDEPIEANPSTATAWRYWKDFNPTYGGTLPAQWVGLPRPMGEAANQWPTGA